MPSQAGAACVCTKQLRMPVQRAADCRSNCARSMIHHSAAAAAAARPSWFPVAGVAQRPLPSVRFASTCFHAVPAQYSASTSRVKRYALLQQGSHRSMGTCRGGAMQVEAQLRGRPCSFNLESIESAQVHGHLQGRGRAAHS